MLFICVFICQLFYCSCFCGFRSHVADTKFNLVLLISCLLGSFRSSFKAEFGYPQVGEFSEQLSTGLWPNPPKLSTNSENLPMKHEYRFTNELLWLTKTSSWLNRSAAVTHEPHKMHVLSPVKDTNPVSFHRHSCLSFLELADFCFIEPTGSITMKLNNARFGMGMESIKTCFDSARLIAKDDAIAVNKLFQQELKNYLWLAGLFFFFERVGSFDLHEIANEGIVSFEYGELDDFELQYLIGIVMFTKTKVNFKIGNSMVKACDLNILNPWRVKDPHEVLDTAPLKSISFSMSNTFDQNEIDIGPECLTMLCNVLNNFEFIRLPGNKRLLEDISLSSSSYENQSSRINQITEFTLFNQSSIGERSNGVGMDKIVSVLRHLPTLNSFELVQCGLGKQCVPKIVKGLQLHSLHLRKLNLSGSFNEVLVVDSESMLSLAHCLKCLDILEELNISKNTLGDGKLEACATVLGQTLTSMPALTNIDLSNTRLGHKGLEALIVSNSFLKRLEYFCIFCYRF